MGGMLPYDTTDLHFRSLSPYHAGAVRLGACVCERLSPHFDHHIERVVLCGLLLRILSLHSPFMLSSF